MKWIIIFLTLALLQILNIIVFSPHLYWLGVELGFCAAFNIFIVYKSIIDYLSRKKWEKYLEELNNKMENKLS